MTYLNKRAKKHSNFLKLQSMSQNGRMEIMEQFKVEIQLKGQTGENESF